MFQKAVVSLVADRWTAFSHVVRFVGVDLTDADFAMQVRASKDQGGGIDPLADLVIETTPGDEGVRFVGVETDGGVPTSSIHIVIAKATMAAMDIAADSGTPGDDGAGWYDLHIAPDGGITFIAMQGRYTVAAGATVSALTDGTTGGGVTVIEVADNGTTVVVSGADQLLAAVATATGAVEAQEALSIAAVEAQETSSLAAVAAATGTATTAAATATTQAGIATTKAGEAAADADSAALLAAGLATVLVSDPLDPRQRVDFADIEGNIFYTVEEGDPTPGELDAATAAAQTGLALEPMDVPAIEIIDGDDNLVARITAADIVHPKIAAIDSGIDAAKIRAWAAQVKAAGPADTDHQIRTTVSHFKKYGQSNSVNTADTLGMPAYPAPLVMFNGGVHTRRGYGNTDLTAVTGSTRTSFVAMQETGSETGMACALSTMLSLATAWGADLSASGAKLLGSSAGVGGVNINSLATTYFFRVEEDIAEAKAIADAANQSYSVSAVLYNGNESDQSTATVSSFRDALRSMQLQIEAEAQSTSGQTWPVPMFIVQTNTHLSTASGSYTNAAAPVALAQVKAGQNLDSVNDNIIFCGPSYQFELATDGVHFSMVGGAVRDALCGVAMFKSFFLGVKQRPLVPTVTVFGDYYRLVFPIDPGRALEWDIATVAAQTNYGFRAFSSGGAARTIGTPRIISHNSVEIYCAAAVAGDVVDYAIATSTGGTRGLGNLRDNQGDDIVTARFGTRVDNWIPAFSETAT